LKFAVTTTTTRTRSKNNLKKNRTSIVAFDVLIGCLLVNRLFSKLYGLIKKKKGISSGKTTVFLLTQAGYKANNSEDTWNQAYNILKTSNATIKDRYHDEGYVFSYWLYEGNKIYRQKLKPKPQK